MRFTICWSFEEIAERSICSYSPISCLRESVGFCYHCFQIFHGCRDQSQHSTTKMKSSLHKLRFEGGETTPQSKPFSKTLAIARLSIASQEVQNISCLMQRSSISLNNFTLIQYPWISEIKLILEKSSRKRPEFII